MNKNDRTELFLDVQSAFRGIEKTDNAVIYICAYDEYDLFYAGNMETLVDVFINAMKEEEILREVISSAVYYLDDEEVNLSLN